MSYSNFSIIIAPEFCQRIDCKNSPTNKICLSLGASATHIPAITTPILWLCDEHTFEVNWEEIAVDKNWPAICKYFKDAGYMEPKKEFSKLLITPVENGNATNNNSSVQE